MALVSVYSGSARVCVSLLPWTWYLYDGNHRPCVCVGFSVHGFGAHGITNVVQFSRWK